jgi:hypothetical protein
MREKSEKFMWRLSAIQSFRSNETVGEWAECMSRFVVHLFDEYNVSKHNSNDCPRSPTVKVGFTEILYNGATEPFLEEVWTLRNCVLHSEFQEFKGWLRCEKVPTMRGLIELCEAVWCYVLTNIKGREESNKKPAAGYYGTPHGAIRILIVKHF